ncbi:tRNA pseudouridine(38-40) synthase TruA [Psychromonas ossibalaenae]|uniref:tRNA pseudouridine(38-40) synthase TruA n=1 Tax=Psychromonas ossibalaenae TaxID=444922 RepID=UPI0003732E95|nr:tRNA pseudouridine(38-40) synthase TruA [Psychromonas ossibalaenae]
MRIALGIEYDGAAYYGWQRQKEVISVQEELEKALSIVANHPVTVNCAGRTDAGVHGTGQVVHFETQSIRKDVAWTLGVNANLPDDIAVRWVKQVDETFHARFSATARRYRYIIYNSEFRPGILRTGLSHYHYALDAQLMQQAGQYIVGEHDFTSFRALHCQANSPVRCIEYLNITRRSDFIIIDIKANAFLHHMVRNIAGSLIEVGRGNQPVNWLETLITYKDRAKAAATAKPGGLYLVEVDYPQEFDLPRPPCGPLFLDI